MKSVQNRKKILKNVAIWNLASDNNFICIWERLSTQHKAIFAASSLQYICYCNIRWQCDVCRIKSENDSIKCVKIYCLD